MQQITIAFVLLFLQTATFANDTTTIKGNAKETELTNAELVLPKGFSAVAITDSVGKARHIKVTKNGVLYIKLSKLVNGKGILRAEDKNGDGKIDDIKSFGNYIGTGITIKNGYLYTSSNDEVFRYKLDENEEVINPEVPEKIITGLINGRQHNTKSIVLTTKEIFM